MFAVIKTGGKQYKVTKDDIIIVEKLEAETGKKVSFDQVLITSNSGAVKVGEPIVKGRAVTGFSNSEEEAVGLTDVVPFLLEDELIKKGGLYQKVDDWTVLAVQDGLIISGQNPASSEATAQKVIAHLNK